MEDEILTYIQSLKGMATEELGLLIIHATHFRNKFEEKLSIELIDPLGAFQQNPKIAILINKMIRENQKINLLGDAAAQMLWLHTIRAITEPELRLHGRNMWKEVIRGMDTVEQQFKEIAMLANKDIDITNYKDLPIGLEPFE